MFGICGVYKKISYKKNIKFQLPINDSKYKLKNINLKKININYIDKSNLRNCFYEDKDHIFLCIGDVEINNKLIRGNKVSYLLHEYYKSKNLNKFVNKNGNFIFLIYDKNQLIIGKSKNSIIPFFYFNDVNELIFSYDISNVKKNIDKETNININKIGQLLLTNGVVLDNETIFEKIHFLLNGEIITCNSKTSFSSKVDYFTYKPVYKDINFHINSVSEKLKKSLKKFNIKKNYNLGLSGGLDSRILAGYLKYTGFKFRTHIYGMKNFDEKSIASKISKILKIKHQEITVKPNDYISDINLSAHICNYQSNITTFPQRKIYKSLSYKYKNSVFMFGSALDCTAGDAWQNIEIKKIKSKKKLLEFYRTNHVFKYNKKNFIKFFSKDQKPANIYEDAYEKLKKMVNEIKSENSFDINSSFFFETRGKRWYNNSLIYPLYYGDIANPFYDKDFLNSLSNVPSDFRENDTFRIKLLENINYQLSNINYNKTMMPANLKYPLNKIMIKECSKKENLKFIKWKKNKFIKKYSSSRYDANFREWLICSSNINTFFAKYFKKKNNYLNNYLNLNFFSKIKKSLINSSVNLKIIIIFISLSLYIENIKSNLKK